MPETKAHKEAKRKAAGSGGEKEVPLKGGGRLDAKSAGGRATEIERSGNLQKLEEAAKRLKQSMVGQRILQVPENDTGLDREAMRNVGVSGTVKHLSGGKSIYVPKKKK